MLKPSFERLPDHVTKKLEDAGFTPEKVLGATDEELLLVPGIGRGMLEVIRQDTKHPLALVLEPFLAVAEEYHKAFESVYPDHSTVLYMQGKVLKVADFRKLFEVIGSEDE